MRMERRGLSYRVSLSHLYIIGSRENTEGLGGSRPVRLGERSGRLRLARYLVEVYDEIPFVACNNKFD
jgi:hypothetical protein